MVDDNGYIITPILEKIKLVDKWEQGIYEMLEGDILEKTHKTEALLSLSAYDFFDAREKHRVEMKKLEAHYKKMRDEAKKRR